MRLVAFLSLLPLLASLAGCATVARFSNLDEPECREDLRHSLATILMLQGEEQEDALPLALESVAALAAADPGPRPFLVASPSGVDYSFFLQQKERRCLLRLYAKRRGFKERVNNLTFIETRELRACGCAR
ncbi:MAG TPA: hypothetical protein VMV46_05925 [Thermoanaerobaculia bacterium]|nr:hypothetical protein [Thermoanaerobaculia bacterium]